MARSLADCLKIAKGKVVNPVTGKLESPVSDEFLDMNEVGLMNERSLEHQAKGMTAIEADRTVLRERRREINKDITELFKQINEKPLTKKEITKVAEDQRNQEINKLQEEYDKAVAIMFPEKSKPDQEKPASKPKTTKTTFAKNKRVKADRMEELKEKVDKGTTQIIKNRHAKKGIDIWVAKLGDRVERDAFVEYKGIAKRYNGYYSSYKGRGAIPGFVFETEKDAQRFKAAIEGVPDSDIDHMIDKASEGLGDLPSEQGQGIAGGGKIVRQNQTDLQNDIEIDDAEVESRFNAANQKSVKEGFLSNVWEDMQIAFRNFKRHFHHLDPSKFGRETNLLRVFESASKYAKNRALQHLTNILKPLTLEQHDIVVRRIIFEDILAGINSGLDKTGIDGTYSFGIKGKEQAERLVTQFTNLMNQEPAAQKAYDTRQVIIKGLYNELVSRGIIKGNENHDTYYHRRVLAHLDDAVNQARISGKKLTQAQRSWMKSRSGIKGMDFSTNFIESEFKVVAEAIYEIKKKDTLEEFLEPYVEILPTLRKEGKEAFERELKKAEQLYGAEDPLYIAFKEDKKKFIEVYVEDNKPDGHELFQPEPGNRLFRMTLYTQKQLEDAIEEAAAKEDMGMGEAIEVFENLIEESRTMLAVGGKKPEYIVPVELADTMRELGEQKRGDKGLAKMSREITTTWKVYVLLNPWRVLKYNLNNFIGDLDGALGADPGILRYARRAARELANYRKTGQINDTLIGKALEQDVIDSGFEYTEIADLNNVDLVKQLSNDETAKLYKLFDKKSVLNMFKPGNFVKAYFDFARKWTVVRENWFRYAAFLRNIDLADKGKVIYGSNNPKVVDAIKDKYQKAGFIARNTLGDYGNISESGQQLRKFWLPFYSWMEVNTSRYYWLMKNATSPQVQARVAGVLLKKGITKVGWKMIQAWAYMAILSAAATAWNKLMFPDEEEELRLANTRGMQFILMRTDDGKVITLPIVGALFDALDWFGIPDMENEMEMIINGTAPKRGLKEIGKKILISPVNKLAQGLNPFVKSTAELVNKKSFYPDVFNPKPIYDRKEYGARFMSMQDEYKAITGTPMRKPYWSPNWLLKKLVMELDPKELAYYATRNLVGKYKGNSGFTTKNPERSNALYNYGRASRFGNDKEADKWLTKYYNLGGTQEGLKTSERQKHPLAWLSIYEKGEVIRYLNGEKKKEDLKYEFTKDLTPSDIKRIRIAIEYYQSLYK